jgi:hypothetical protein
VVALIAVELVVVLAWASEQQGAAPATQALRLGGAIWLTSLHARVHSGAAVFGIAPLGLTLLSAVLVTRSAAALARARREAGEASVGPLAEALRIVPAVAVPYAVVAAILAGVVGSRDLHVSAPTALLGGLVVSGVASAYGVRRAHGGWELEWPEALRTASAAAAAALGVAAVLALVLTVAALIRHASTYGDLTRALAPGVVGGVALGLLNVALAPNAVVCGLAWLAGPGFAVGAGTAVSPTHIHLGEVPALPLLAALPAGLRGPGLVVLLAPVLAGVVAGVVVHRRTADAPLLPVAGLAAAAGVLVAVLAAGLAAAAGGPAGSGRLLTIGPSWWAVGLALGLEVGVAATVTATVGALLRGERRLRLR